MKIEISGQIFEKYSKQKFSRKSTQWGTGHSMRIGQTDRRADMTRLIVAFHRFAKAPNNAGLK
jgi:hypothetical protein